MLWHQEQAINTISGKRWRGDEIPVQFFGRTKDEIWKVPHCFLGQQMPQWWEELGKGLHPWAAAIPGHRTFAVPFSMISLHFFLQWDIANANIWRNSSCATPKHVAHVIIGKIFSWSTSGPFFPNDYVCNVFCVEYWCRSTGLRKRNTTNFGICNYLNAIWITNSKKQKLLYISPGWSMVTLEIWPTYEQLFIY